MAEFKSWLGGPPSSGWECKTRIAFGNGLFEKLGELVSSIGAKKAFVVADTALAGRGILDKALTLLKNASIESEGFGDVQPNVPLDNIAECMKLAKRKEWDIVVAIGGGSSIDFGKAIAILLTNKGDLRSYAGAYRVSIEPLPICAIPTTAGTGAEVTGVVVIGDPETHAKFSILSDKVIPRVAILDPLLTMSLPREVTIACGMDALVHGIECYINSFINPIASHLAGLSIRIINSNLEKVVATPKNEEARYQMLLGSLLAGLAFKDRGLGLGHAMSYPLTGMFGIPHGIANAILLPIVMNYNAEYCFEEMAEVGILLGSSSKSSKERVRYAIRRVEELLSTMGIPDNISGFGAGEEHLDDMVKDTFQEGRKPLLWSNPREPKVEEVKDLFRRVIRPE